MVKPASSFVLLFNAGGFVPLWDIDDCNMIRTFRGRLCREVNAVALSQNGILALSGSHDGTAWLWDIDSGGLIQCFDSKLRNEYTSEPVPVTCVGFVFNGQFRRTVLTGNGDGCIMLWNMEDMGKLLRTAWPHGNPYPYPYSRNYVTVAMLSYDGRFAFSVICSDNRLKMWSVASGLCIKYFVHDCFSIARAVLSSEGETLFTACRNGATMLWDISSGDCIRSFGAVVGHECTNCADLTRDDEFVIGFGPSGCLGMAVLWEACTGKRCRRFQHSCGLLLFVDLSSDSQFALTGGSDGIVRIWNTISGDCVAIPPSSALYGVTVVTFVS